MKVENSYTASWFEVGWGEKSHRLESVMWTQKPPQKYLDEVEYVRRRREIAAKREDAQRVEAGEEPLWFS